MMSREEAAALGKSLQELAPSILGIELFGSTLTMGYGHDADFMVLVDEGLSKKWWHEERESIRVRWPEPLYGWRWMVKRFARFSYTISVRKRRHERLEAAACILGINIEQLADARGIVPDFEMFLVPSNWRSGKAVNENAMRRVTDLMDDENTRGFLRRVAKEAVRIA